MRGRESIASCIVVKSPAAGFLSTVREKEGTTLFIALWNTECLRPPTNLTHLINCRSTSWAWVRLPRYGRWRPCRRPLVWLWAGLGFRMRRTRRIEAKRWEIEIEIDIVEERGEENVCRDCWC